MLASGRGAACVVTPPSQHAQQALSSVPAAVPPVPPRPAVTLAKSVKNAAELAGLREAHLRDGVALVRFLCWLEKTIASGGRCNACATLRRAVLRHCSAACLLASPDKGAYRVQQHGCCTAISPKGCRDGSSTQLLRSNASTHIMDLCHPCIGLLHALFIAQASP